MFTGRFRFILLRIHKKYKYNSNDGRKIQLYTVSTSKYLNKSQPHTVSEQSVIYSDNKNINTSKSDLRADKSDTD